MSNRQAIVPVFEVLPDERKISAKPSNENTKIEDTNFTR